MKIFWTKHITTSTCCKRVTIQRSKRTNPYGGFSITSDLLTDNVSMFLRNVSTTYQTARYHNPYILQENLSSHTLINMAASRTPLGPTKLLFNEYRALVLRGWGGWGMKATTQYTAQVKNSWSYTYAPQHVCMSWWRSVEQRGVFTWLSWPEYTYSTLSFSQSLKRRGTNTNVHQRLQGKVYSFVEGRCYKHILPVRGFAHCHVAYFRRTVTAKPVQRGVGPSLICSRACEADLPT